MGGQQDNHSDGDRAAPIDVPVVSETHSKEREQAGLVKKSLAGIDSVFNVLLPAKTLRTPKLTGRDAFLPPHSELVKNDVAGGVAEPTILEVVPEMYRCMRRATNSRMKSFKDDSLSSCANDMFHLTYAARKHEPYFSREMTRRKHLYDPFVTTPWKPRPQYVAMLKADCRLYDSVAEEKRISLLANKSAAGNLAMPAPGAGKALDSAQGPEEVQQRFVEGQPVKKRIKRID